MFELQINDRTFFVACLKFRCNRVSRVFILYVWQSQGSRVVWDEWSPKFTC